MSPIPISFYKKYKVLSKVGEGSFSEVLKCQERSTGNLFAAKRLKRIKQSMEEALTSTELISLVRLQSHPHILNLIEKHIDPLPGKLTLIFELMDMSLYDLIRSRKRAIPESRVKVYVHQVLKGLNHMHKNGLFHRDIKPENILLKNDVVKIADLGSVKGMYMRRPFTEYISTRWYRAPECLLTKGVYGAKMDIWAAGCVFFELITLRPLFPGHSEVDMLHKIHKILGTPHPRTVTKFKHQANHRNCEYFFPPRGGIGLASLMPNVSESGSDFVKQTLVYDPDLRANVRRLLEHRYFNDLREIDESPCKKTRPPISPAKFTDWRNPVLLSNFLSGARRKKHKHATSVSLVHSQAASLVSAVSDISESTKAEPVAPPTPPPPPPPRAVHQPPPAPVPHLITHRVPSHFIKQSPARPKALERTFASCHNGSHKKDGTGLTKKLTRREPVQVGRLPGRLPPIHTSIRGQPSEPLATGQQSAGHGDDNSMLVTQEVKACIATLPRNNVLRLPPILKKSDKANLYSPYLPQCVSHAQYATKLSSSVVSRLETIVEHPHRKPTRIHVTSPHKP